MRFSPFCTTFAEQKLTGNAAGKSTVDGTCFFKWRGPQFRLASNGEKCITFSLQESTIPKKINRELSAVDKSGVDIARFECKGPDFLRFKHVGVWTPLSQVGVVVM